MFSLSRDGELFLAKNKNKKIVFTNGCFDILHAGHVTYLNEAKKLGDLLFIGLNSDQSIRELKGPLRPICSELERKFLLENLRCVDFVEIFNESTPLELIEKVRPQLLVKGGDWRVEQIVGHEIVLGDGGEVKSLSFISGFSTTNIIDQIIHRHNKN